MGWFWGSQNDVKPVATSNSGCPVDHTKINKSDSSCPVNHTQMSKNADSGCPVDHSSKNSKNENINPLNQMPNLKNEMIEGQIEPLSTKKTLSSIKNKVDDKDSVWEYPSPQQFYNALVRKGWETQESDIDTMVSIHNFLNEECWKEVLNWENKYHCDCTEDRSLIRFKGRPQEPTPKALILTKLGLVERPFDRHDWTINRCGKEVRYCIDYYGGDDVKQADGSNSGEDLPVFHCDVRPALDNPSALFDRTRNFASECWNRVFS
ncbi:holocytochrome c synthase [Lobulomyces angularis]|nr:holocytochrome c synthase [Lobulomyces angularis]